MTKVSLNVEPRAVSQTAYFILWTIVFTAVIVQQSFFAASTWLLATEGTLMVAVGMITLSKLSPGGFWSPSSLFFLVLAVFHLGLAPYWIVGMRPRFPRPSDYEWFYGSIGTTALGIVVLALAGYMFGFVVFGLLHSGGRELSLTNEAASESEPPARASFYAAGGAFLLLFSIALWVEESVRYGGVGIFLDSYLVYLEATDGSLVGYSYISMGIGLGLTCLSFRPKITKVALLAYLAFSLVAFFIGLRGEVLFPTAVAASVLAVRKKLPRGLVIAPALLVLLALINGAKNIRQSGLGDIELVLAEFNPFIALAELGSTLRVLAHTVIWHSANNEPFRAGDTYTVSVVRLLESLFKPGGEPPAFIDYRLMNVEVADRSGNIGGSIIAEAYHNFDIVGAVTVLFLVGLLMAYFTFKKSSTIGAAIYVCAAVPLFNHIRNSFVPVIPLFIFGMLFILALEILRRSPARMTRNSVEELHRRSD